MRLMTYNILEGGEGRVDPLAEVVRLARADVVIVQECGDRALFDKLADRLGMDRFQAEMPGNGTGAVGVMSKWKIREAVNWGAVSGQWSVVSGQKDRGAGNDQGSMANDQGGGRANDQGSMANDQGGGSALTRAGLHVIVEKGGVALPIVGVHLHAGERMADEAVRLEELGRVLEIAGAFRGRVGGHVIAGDFNSYHPAQVIDVSKVRPSAQKRVAEQGNEFPREVVRRMLEAGYVDAHTLHHGAAEFGCSFTTAYPAARVDYIFVSPDLCPRVRSCEVFMPGIGRYASDHYPVVAELETNDQ